MTGLHIQSQSLCNAAIDEAMEQGINDYTPKVKEKKDDPDEYTNDYYEMDNDGQVKAALEGQMKHSLIFPFIHRNFAFSPLMFVFYLSQFFNSCKYINSLINIISPTLFHQFDQFGFNKTFFFPSRINNCSVSLDYPFLNYFIIVYLVKNPKTSQ